MQTIHDIAFDPAAVSGKAGISEATLNEAKALPLSRHLLAKRVRDIFRLRDGALLPTLD